MGGCCSSPPGNVVETVGNTGGEIAHSQSHVDGPTIDEPQAADKKVGMTRGISESSLGLEPLLTHTTWVAVEEEDIEAERNGNAVGDQMRSRSADAGGPAFPRASTQVFLRPQVAESPYASSVHLSRVHVRARSSMLPGMAEETPDTPTHASRRDVRSFASDDIKPSRSGSLKESNSLSELRPHDMPFASPQSQASQDATRAVSSAPRWPSAMDPSEYFAPSPPAAPPTDGVQRKNRYRAVMVVKLLSLNWDGDTKTAVEVENAELWFSLPKYNVDQHLPRNTRGMGRAGGDQGQEFVADFRVPTPHLDGRSEGILSILTLLDPTFSADDATIARLRAEQEGKGHRVVTIEQFGMKLPMFEQGYFEIPMAMTLTKRSGTLSEDLFICRKEADGRTPRLGTCRVEFRWVIAPHRQAAAFDQLGLPAQMVESESDSDSSQSEDEDEPAATIVALPHQPTPNLAQVREKTQNIRTGGGRPLSGQPASSASDNQKGAAPASMGPAAAPDTQAVVQPPKQQTTRKTAASFASTSSLHPPRFEFKNVQTYSSDDELSPAATVEEATTRSSAPSPVVTQKHTRKKSVFEDEDGLWAVARELHQYENLEIDDYDEALDSELAKPQDKASDTVQAIAVGRQLSSFSDGKANSFVSPTSAAAWERRSSLLPSNKIEWKPAADALLGKGAFAEVHLGLNLNSGHLMAVKHITINPDLLAEKASGKDDRLTALKQEVEVLRILDHPHIVKYLGMEIDKEEGHVDIFLEYVPGGSIAALIQQFDFLPEPLVKRFTAQILDGLVYLHKRKIVHRDIKGGNVLVDVMGNCKIADFGTSSHIVDLTESGKTITGTPYWMAPEVILQQGHGRKVDIWSVGCTVIEMCTGRPPWHQFKTVGETLHHIATTDDPPELPVDLSDEGKDFILWCLQRDRSQRPTAAQLLNDHPWFADLRGKKGPEVPLDESHHTPEGQLSGTAVSPATSDAPFTASHQHRNSAFSVMTDDTMPQEARLYHGLSEDVEEDFAKSQASSAAALPQDQPESGEYRTRSHAKSISTADLRALSKSPFEMTSRHSLNPPSSRRSPSHIGRSLVQTNPDDNADTQAAKAAAVLEIAAAEAQAAATGAAGLGNAFDNEVEIPDSPDYESASGSEISSPEDEYDTRPVERKATVQSYAPGTRNPYTSALSAMSRAEKRASLESGDSSKGARGSRVEQFSSLSQLRRLSLANSSMRSATIEDLHTLGQSRRGSSLLPPNEVSMSRRASCSTQDVKSFLFRKQSVVLNNISVTKRAGSKSSPHRAGPDISVSESLPVASRGKRNKRSGIRPSLLAPVFDAKENSASPRSTISSLSVTTPTGQTIPAAHGSPKHAHANGGSDAPGASNRSPASPALSRPSKWKRREESKDKERYDVDGATMMSMMSHTGLQEILSQAQAQNISKLSGASHPPERTVDDQPPSPNAVKRLQQLARRRANDEIRAMEEEASSPSVPTEKPLDHNGSGGAESEFRVDSLLHVDVPIRSAKKRLTPLVTPPLSPSPEPTRASPTSPRVLVQPPQDIADAGSMTALHGPVDTALQPLHAQVNGLDHAADLDERHGDEDYDDHSASTLSAESVPHYERAISTESRVLVSPGSAVSAGSRELAAALDEVGAESALDVLAVPVPPRAKPLDQDPLGRSPRHRALTSSVNGISRPGALPVVNGAGTAGLPPLKMGSSSPRRHRGDAEPFDL